MSLPPARPVRRRTLLGSGIAVGALVPLATVTTPAGAATHQRLATASGDKPAVARAVRFLAAVTDAHHTTGPRLAQSYCDGSGLDDIAFVYDNALALIALLAAGDVRHARAIGDALLFAQSHDETFTDSRLRQAYHADTFVNGAGTEKETAHFGWEFGLVGTAVGDMAWAGIALAQLARKTGVAAYRQGTLAIGRWIHENTYSDDGLGGYTFGETADLTEHKSTEHNIDVYAYFRLLAKLTGDSTWTARAAHAWAFVTRVWNADDGYFWTGSDDGTKINQTPAQRPLDVQTWSWLAAAKPGYAAALDWAAGNLATTDTPVRANSALTGHQSVRGVAFASGSLTTDTETTIGNLDYTPKPDDCAVWFEGSAQLTVALRDRGHAGDAAAAADLLTQLRFAQRELGRGQVFGGARVEGGIVAASSPMDTGFQFGYFANLHVGATAWYVFAATGTNPYWYL
ncbi:hypothetical protein [uncultured Friedmanniella sp.]|uniref:hypothetical protein n=1 Tax=uncultured Friedmanniella sp. TaxID=335381 RepID=UPI0035CAED90